MYVAVRRYEGVSDPQKVGQVAREGFLPIISELPGFVAYYTADAGDGVMISTSVFEHKEAEEQTNYVAGEFVKEHVAPLLPNPPQITADTKSHAVTAATVDGVSLEEAPGQRQDTDPSRWGFVFHGGPPEGIDVTLEVRGEGPLLLRVITYRDGLPQVPELTPRPDDLTWSGTSSNLTMITKSYRV